jgi:molecular chaperone DnaK (HSP70)
LDKSKFSCFIYSCIGTYTDTKISFKSIDPTPCQQSAHPIDYNGAPAFSIHDKEEGDASTVTVPEITTRHLRKLKTSAADFLGKEVNAAVITVPTNFTDAQKDALKKAAWDAGIEVLQFIGEPVAAVLAYDARPGASQTDKVIVVADLGGIRSDIAVVASRGGIYTLLATSHDFDVSGSKLDEKLMEYFAKEYLKKHKSADDPRQNDRSLAKLRLESEAVKKALSLGNSATFSVESLSSGNDYTCTVNRTRYEMLGRPVFEAIDRLILHAIEKAEYDPLDITDVILSGGLSHTPRIAANISSLFKEKATVWAPSSKTDAINPSEVAARGAAIQASLIGDFDTENIQESEEPVVTVTPHLKNALGVLCISDSETHGRFQPIIEADTPTPVRRSAIVATPREGGDVLVKLVEGLRHIKVEKVEKSQANGNKDEDDSDDDSDDDEEDEPEETRSKVWNVGKAIAELAIKGVKKGGKVEVQIDVRPDFTVSITAREIGGKGGVRGQLDAPATTENGKA